MVGKYKKTKRMLLNFILTTCIFTTVWSGWRIGEALWQGKENREVLESVAEVVKGASEDIMASESNVSEVNTTPADGRLAGYQELWEQNHDLAGWIHIEGTGLDTPVMQTGEKEAFYLNHDFRKEPSDYGVPFIDGSCEIENACGNVVVYGHHMKDGSMFADLIKYEEKNFWEMHPVIQFDTLEECGEYRIIGAMRVPAVEEEREFYSNILVVDEMQREAFLNQVEKRSFYDCGEKAQAGEPLLTLITCEYSTKEGRMVVVAKKIS